MDKPLKNGWEEVGCILCGVQAQQKVVWQDIEHSKILRCSHCGLVFRSPRPCEGEITQVFKEEWTEVRQAFYLEDFREKILKRIMKWILNRHPTPGAILDIGSSYGNFLAQFPATWRRIGIEPSNLACQVARKKLPEALIINSTLAKATLPRETFDFITIIDAVYFLSQPLRDLARLPGLLKPEGALLVESFNFANRGPVYRWMGHAFGETFLYFYTPTTLEKILGKIGMRVINRIDLPGHQIGSRKILSRAMTWAEFAITKATQKISKGKIDFVPHFVLVCHQI